MLPNAIGAVIVAATLGVGGAILTEPVLSFLGLGVQLPTPSWGKLLATSQTTLTTAPWLALALGVFIWLIILSVNYWVTASETRSIRAATDEPNS